MKIFLLSLLVLNVAFGADEVISDQPNVISTTVPGTKRITSADNRNQVKFQASISPIGIENSVNALSASLGHYITSNDLILLKYSNFNGNDYVNKLNAFTLGYRRFEGNSFNVMPTVYYSRSTNNEGIYSGNGIYQTLTYNEMGIGFRIGNEWQWENFLLGMDWIGINRSLYVSQNYKSSKTYDDDINYTATVLNLNVGYSF